MSDMNFSTTSTDVGSSDDETMSVWSVPECSGDGDRNPVSSSSSTRTCLISELDDDDSSTSCDTVFEESIEG